MSYVVLARKWRPQQFSEVIGQDHVARTLSNAIEQDRVAHAFIFTGARGVGKTSTARILARALNCEKGPTSTPCYQCSACTEITEGRSVDVFEIDGASNRGINEIRELRESVRYAPSRDRYKVYIIDEVHMLTTEAFNALLKTLEEPPPHAKFIFATTEPQKIPVTILSRCQRYDFKRIQQKEIVDHLHHLCDSEGIEIDRESLHIIARQAAGGMRDALSLLDQIISFGGKTIRFEDVAQILGVANRRHLFEISQAVLAANAHQTLEILSEVDTYGYDLQQFTDELIQHFRDLLVVAVTRHPEALTELTETEVQEVRDQVDGVSSELFHRHLGILIDAGHEISRSSWPKVILEMALIRMASLEPLVGIDLLVDRLASLEGLLDSGTSGPDAAPSARVAPRDRAAEDPPATGKQHDGPSSQAGPTSASGTARAEAVTRPDVARPGADSSASTRPDPSAKSERPVVPSSDVPADAPVKDSQQVVEREAQAKFTSKSAPDSPGSDSGTSTTLAPIDKATIASLSPHERWEKVVEQLKTMSLPLAAQAAHAYVERFEDGEVEVSFVEPYLTMMSDTDRIEALQKALQSRFSEHWRLRIHTRAQDLEDGEMTLAQRNEVVRQEKLEKLEEEVRESPAVKRAKEIFQVPDDNVKVQVKLFDE